VGHFRQLFDPTRSAYTYLLADLEAREAIVIDGAARQVATMLAWLDELDLALRYVTLTHFHAGERDETADLRRRSGAAAAAAATTGLPWLDVGLRHGDTLVFGNQVAHVLGTPGHTRGCVSFLWQDRVFTGDALLIGSCGRTNLPGGDAGTLYDSVVRRLFLLPGETLVYPGHDHRGRTVSTIAEERQHNPRFAGRSRDEFITLMATAAATGAAADSAERATLQAIAGGESPRSQTARRVESSMNRTTDRASSQASTDSTRRSR
jgi:glyoxylase-like metal-dependent hydrolase (beta-lactamase superfamily II)